MNNKRFLARGVAGACLGLLLALAGLSLPAVAAVPDSISYQGYLTNADGTPVDTTVTITFAAYSTDVGGAPLWTQTETIVVVQGLFQVALANPVNPFPAGMFDNPVYIGLFVAGEEMLPRRALTSNAYAFKAGDADTLSGLDATALNQSAEVAALEGELDTYQTQLAGAVDDLSLASVEIDNIFLRLQDVDVAIARTSADVSANAGGISTLQSDVIAHNARLTNIESVGADITGVSTNNGLVGGGSAGNVTLGIGNNAVTGAMVQDGAIGPADLDATGAYVVDTLTADTEFVYNAPGGSTLRMQPIFGSSAALYWFGSDNAYHASVGADSIGLLLDTSGSGFAMDARVDGRVGLAGALPAAGSGYDVAVPSLEVQGTIDINRSVVSQVFDLDDRTFGCPTFGGLDCYYGQVTVQCPVGTKTLGGGMRSGAPFGQADKNGPNGDTAWFCAAMHDAPNVTRTCYVICANVD